MKKFQLDVWKFQLDIWKLFWDMFGENGNHLSTYIFYSRVNPSARQAFIPFKLLQSSVIKHAVMPEFILSESNDLLEGAVTLSASRWEGTPTIAIQLQFSKFSARGEK